MFFFRSGRAIAVSNVGGKEPERKDVSDGRKQVWKVAIEDKEAGMGSSSHGLKDIDFKVLILLFQRQDESRRAVFR